MQDSFGESVVLGVPDAGTRVQDVHKITLHLLQSGAQSFGKEFMIAIPLALVIQGDEK